MSNKRGLIVMTALPPTLGHSYLIQFASNFMYAKHGVDSLVDVFLFSRSCEPISGEIRADALQNHLLNNNIYRINLMNVQDDSVPQNPSESETFWDDWKNIIEKYSRNTKINKRFNNAKYDYVFASEHYGNELAKVLNAEFIPVDINREVLSISATEYRNDPIWHYDSIIKEYRFQYARKSVTIFGAESCGKTTISRNLKLFSKGIHSFHEWARPYLEEVGSELTPDKMNNIASGQYALMKYAQKYVDKPLHIFDTDLFSTYGYYKILGWDIPKSFYDKMFETQSDLYIVMNDKIPFVKDLLRYGGDKRESNSQFWIDILEEFKLPYYVVESIDLNKRLDEVYWYIEKWYKKSLANLHEFIRT